MKEATQELLWMSQKEENELSRDWADKNLDVNELEEYRKVGICYVLIENLAEYFQISFQNCFKLFGIFWNHCTSFQSAKITIRHLPHIVS